MPGSSLKTCAGAKSKPDTDIAALIAKVNGADLWRAAAKTLGVAGCRFGFARRRNILRRQDFRSRKSQGLSRQPGDQGLSQMMSRTLKNQSWLMAAAAQPLSSTGKVLALPQRSSARRFAIKPVA